MKQHFLAMATATLVAFGADAAATTASTTNNVGAQDSTSSATNTITSGAPAGSQAQGAAVQSSNTTASTASANVVKNNTPASSTANAATASSTSKTNVDKSIMVKCYGIALKGQNDCASANGLHSCAAEAATDYDPCEWKAVTLATCNSGVKNSITGAIVKGSQSPTNCQVDNVSDATVAVPNTASAPVTNS